MTIRTSRKALAATFLATPVVAAAIFAGSAAAAPGTSTPPWEPDPNSQAPYAGINFYDVNGNPVTSGTNLNHLFDYAEAAGPGRGAALDGNKATIYFAAPSHTAASTANFYQGSGPVGGPTTYPVATAPANLSSDPFPVVALGPNDGNLNAFLGGAVLDTTPGYANLIQVRIATAGVGTRKSAPNYFSADIAYNTTSAATQVDGVTVPANGWALVYEQPNSTAPIPPAGPPSSVPEFANPVALVAGGMTLAGGAVVILNVRRRRRISA